MSTVTVACNTPTGFICELGLELDYSLQRFVRTPKYRSVKLNGSQHSALALIGGDTNRFLPMRGREPGLTQVDEEFIREWLRQHPKLAAHIWIVDKPADLKHQIGDRPAAPFEPIDPSTRMRVDGAFIEEADFHKDNVAQGGRA